MLHTLAYVRARAQTHTHTHARTHTRTHGHTHTHTPDKCVAESLTEMRTVFVPVSSLYALHASVHNSDHKSLDFVEKFSVSLSLSLCLPFSLSPLSLVDVLRKDRLTLKVFIHGNSRPWQKSRTEIPDT